MKVVFSWPGDKMLECKDKAFSLLGPVPRPS